MCRMRTESLTTHVVALAVSNTGLEPNCINDISIGLNAISVQCNVCVRLWVSYQVSSVGRRQEILEVTDSSWGEVRREEARRTLLHLQTDCRGARGGARKKLNKLNEFNIDLN